MTERVTISLYDNEGRKNFVENWSKEGRRCKECKRNVVFRNVIKRCKLQRQRDEDARECMGD